MPNRVFHITIEYAPERVGYYTIAGVRHGPFATPDAMELDILQLMERWNRRAKHLGGHVWRRTHQDLVVSLPERQVIEGGEPLEAWVPRR